MSRPVKLLFAFVLFLAVAGFVAYSIVPNAIAKAVPGFLNDQVSSYIEVDDAHFNHSPPELVLTGVHLKNPPEFGAGDAVTIGQVNVVFDRYSREPYYIRSITVQQIAGKQVVRNGTDNFAALHKDLMNKKLQTPRGELAKPVVLKRFIIHDASVTSEDGSITTPLAEKRLTPQGVMANNPPLQTVITDVLGTILEQQQAGTTVLAVEGLTNQARDTIKSIGDSIKSFLSGQ